MSFSRANPTGWSFATKITSAQLNQLDADHANSLDKTTAGDQLSGKVTVINAGQLQATAVGSITASVAAGIQSGTTGGIQLNGGASDWPTFSANRSRVIFANLEYAPVATTLSTNVPVGLTPGTMPAPPTTAFSQASLLAGSMGVKGSFVTVTVLGTTPGLAYYVPIRTVHNASTLTLVSLSLIGASGHSALPSQMPAYGVYRSFVNNSPTGAPQALLSTGGGVVTDSSANATAYKAQHAILYTPNQNNVIDVTNYVYFVVIWDECGTNALSGNEYLALQFTFSSIADLRFQ